MNDAGKVAFTPKGAYVSTETYEHLDTVQYNGNCYAAKKTTTGNTPPTTGTYSDDYWAVLVIGGASVPVATLDTPGLVKAGEDIVVNGDGDMSLKTDFEEQTEIAGLTGSEDRKTLLGKIAKAIIDFIAHKTLKATASVLGHVKISNSAAITTEGEYALDAVEKNASVEGTLAYQIAQQNDNLENAYGKIESYGSYTPSATYKNESICTITANKKGKMLILANISVHTSRFMHLRNTTKAVNLSNVNFGNGINCILAVAQVDDGDVITLNSQFTATTELNYSVQAFYIV